MKDFVRYSPGSILTHSRMKQVVDLAPEVDCLDDDSCKRDWLYGRQGRWGIAAFEPYRWWLALAGKHSLIEQIKHWRQV